MGGREEEVRPIQEACIEERAGLSGSGNWADYRQDTIPGAAIISLSELFLWTRHESEKVPTPYLS